MSEFILGVLLFSIGAFSGIMFACFDHVDYKGRVNNLSEAKIMCANYDSEPETLNMVGQVKCKNGRVFSY